MIIQVTSDNVDVSQSMQELAKSKLANLERYLSSYDDDSKKIRVVMNVLKDDKYEVKVELVVEGTTYFSESQDFSMETALIESVGDVERQYKKDKSKKDTEAWSEQRERKRFEFDEEDLILDEDDVTDVLGTEIAPEDKDPEDKDL